ncbi:hypothetical protein [Glutamicibacter sp.]|uniref:hypothetical protein n=1 Tax=Glutamicibacter sp. TaxID=1931995 RepID=UPI0028BEB999|nr:hypothetical protein [Glutamicibacter sp.]
MAKRYFRHNGGRGAEANAEAKACQVRQETFDRAKDKAVHLLHALKSWPGYDATGNILGAMDHTDATIDALDEVLDELRDEMDKFRGIKCVEIRPVIPDLNFGISKLLHAAEVAAKYAAMSPKSEVAITPLESQIVKSRKANP